MDRNLEEILEEIGSSIAGMMGTQPINVVGKDHPSKYEKQDRKRQKKAQLNYKYMKIRGKKGNIEMNENLKQEIMGLVESILNEKATVGQLSKAVDKVVDKRKNEARVASKALKNATDRYEYLAKKHPEDEPALYKRLEAVDKAAVRANDRAEHAEDLKRLNLPKNSKVSANKLFKAADKVEAKREKETEKAMGKDREKFAKAFDRDKRAFDLYYADPVKSRVSESVSKEIMGLVESILNEREAEIMNSPFPKKAIEAKNAKYLEADKKAVETSRLYRKALDKFNKETNKAKKEGIDVDAYSHTWGDRGRALNTVKKLGNKKLEADKELIDAESTQKQLKKQGLKGIAHRPLEIANTKKGDSYNFHKGHIKLTEELAEILESILVEAGASDAAMKLAKSTGTSLVPAKKQEKGVELYTPVKSEKEQNIEASNRVNKQIADYDKKKADKTEYIKRSTEKLRKSLGK